MVVYQLLKNALALKQNEKLTREELQRQNILRFRELVKYAQKNSLYYRRLIQKNNINIDHCSPQDFPILTKELLIKHFDEIVTDHRITKETIAKFLSNSRNPHDLFINTFHVLHTSGTSGQIGYFVYSKNEWIRGFSQSVRIHKLGIRKKLAYVAATGGHFAGVSLVDFGRASINKLFYNIKIFDINKPFSEIISNLNDFQPDAVVGYATALSMLAHAQEKGELHITPKMLESGGEPLFSEDRGCIEKIFKAPVINVYASSEHLIMGIGKQEYNGMYLMEDDLIFEFHKDHICVTNLFNKTMPLIRYKMNDILILQEDAAHIFPFTKIKDLVGRNEYMPIFINRNGKEDFIHPIVFVEFFVQNLKQFQIQLMSKNSFVFRALLKDSLSKEEKKQTLQQIKEQLKKILDEKHMENVKFKITEVKELGVDKKTGKFRLIIK